MSVEREMGNVLYCMKYEVKFDSNPFKTDCIAYLININIYLTVEVGVSLIVARTASKIQSDYRKDRAMSNYHQGYNANTMKPNEKINRLPFLN